MKRILQFALTITLSSNILFAENRIKIEEGDKDKKALRCTKSGMAAEKCETIRKKSLEEGCISQEEYDVLLKYGAYPSCNKYEEVPQNMLDGWCPCGCFHPDTLIRVLTADGLDQQEKAGKIANTPSAYQLLHLNAEENRELQPSPIRLAVSGLESQDLYVVLTHKGTLKLTSRHPVLLFSGKMIPVSELKADDILIDIVGEPVRVKKISRETFLAPVVNFSVEAETLREHVIFALDLAVGDQY